MEPEICLDRLAERMRRWRDERGFTLQQLGTRSGVAASTIHKIEVRKTVPTVAVLCRIAHGLERPLTAFLEEEPAASTRVHRADERFAPLAPGLSAARLGEPGHPLAGLRALLQAGGDGAALRVRGELALVCESGALEISGEPGPFSLGPGDVLVLDSRAPGRLTLRARETARFLLFGDLPEDPRALLAGPTHAVRRPEGERRREPSAGA